MIRETLLKKIKIIILPYLAVSPLADFIEYNLKLEEKHTKAEAVKDNWNFWTGSLGLRGSMFDMGYRKEYNGFSNLSMRRITEKHKFDIGGFFNYNYVWANNNGDISTGNRIGYSAYNINAFSLGNHFATGYFASYSSSTVTNLKSNSAFFAAFEYNVFPYSKATRKLLRMLYRIGGRYQEYFSTTVLDKDNMMLFPHSFILEFTQIEKWGTIDLTAGVTHYLNYSQNYNITMLPSVSLNPFKGFKLNLGCAYTIVNDQFFLRKGNVSSSQVLLGQVQLKTASTLSAVASLNFNFGSIYSNVVNVRFDLDGQFW